MKVSTGFVTVAKGARTPGSVFLPSVVMIAGLIRREVKKTFVSLTYGQTNDASNVMREWSDIAEETEATLTGWHI